MLSLCSWHLHHERKQQRESNSAELSTLANSDPASAKGTNHGGLRKSLTTLMDEASFDDDTNTTDTAAHGSNLQHQSSSRVNSLGLKVHGQSADAAAANAGSSSSSNPSNANSRSGSTSSNTVVGDRRKDSRNSDSGDTIAIEGGTAAASNGSSDGPVSSSLAAVLSAK